MAKHIYVREARRIVAETRVVEQDIASDLRPSAREYPDSVGIGCYRIDLHPTTDGDPYVDIGCHPFQVPLGALLPVRIENLLPACKNLGVTHITNGAYRLHPTEWAIGEAAGKLAAYLPQRRTVPRHVRATPAQLGTAFQAMLIAQGIPVRWPDCLPCVKRLRRELSCSRKEVLRYPTMHAWGHIGHEYPALFDPSIGYNPPTHE